MKTQEEIEQLAKQDFNDRQECGHYELADLKSRDYYYDGFSNGYTQCQKDMIKSDMIKSVCPKCACEPHTFYEWEKDENKCSQCGKPIYEQTDL